jgi:hypothetical protein
MNRRNAMKRFLTIRIAAILVLVPLAGLASAASMHGSTAGIGGNGSTAAPTAIGDASAGTDWTIRHWKGGQFSVMPLDDVYSNGEAAAISAHASEPKQVSALQSAIEHNPALSNRLKSENVEIRNVIDADTAMDGKITFYVR